jgi:hypothetical protein
MAKIKEYALDNGETILAEALKNPGVAEVLKLYEEANERIKTSERAFEAIRPRIVYLTSDNTLI